MVKMIIITGLTFFPEGDVVEEIEVCVGYGESRKIRIDVGNIGTEDWEGGTEGGW